MPKQYIHRARVCPLKSKKIIPHVQILQFGRNYCNTKLNIDKKNFRLYILGQFFNTSQMSPKGRNKIGRMMVKLRRINR